MGKTDKYIIPIYKNIIKEYIKDDTAFFGSDSNDKLANAFDVKYRYDKKLNNWDINSNWNINQKHSSIICFRTSGFSKNPKLLLENFYHILDNNGILIIDWSLGSDHYLTRKSKEWTWGWELNEERCYGEYGKTKCFLYSSCLTTESTSSTAFDCLYNYSLKQKKYKKCTKNQLVDTIKQEFDEYLIDEKDITKYFDIIKEFCWTPIAISGRAQFYIIHTLKRRSLNA